jgi:transposase-like protein
MPRLYCPNCFLTGIDKGRAADGRRAYRCQSCGHIWTNGLNGRKKRYSIQRLGDQFHDTGASKYYTWEEFVKTFTSVTVTLVNDDE